MFWLLLALMDDDKQEYILEIYETYLNEFMRYAYSICHNLSDSEDAVNHAMEKLINKLMAEDISDWTVENVKRYVFTVCKNYCRHIQNEANRYDDEIDLSAVRSRTAVETEAIKKTLIGTVLENVQSLAGRERDIFMMYYYEGKKHKDIAREFGITEKNSSAILHRTVDKLRKTMGLGGEQYDF